MILRRERAGESCDIYIYICLYSHHADSPERPMESPSSPVGHVQEEGASGRVELEAEKPLELRYQDVFVRRAHAAEFLH